MNNSNEHDETKHLGDTEEVATRWQNIKKLFEAASALTGRERQKFLKKSCGDDADLRAEVEKLLRSFEDSETFLEKGAAVEVADLIEERQTLIGQNTTGDISRGSFVAGTVLASRYRIIGMIGKGGMGEVYKAEDIKLGQVVALKFLPDSFQKDSAALERFHAEVRNARQVSHVNVCRVFDIGEIEGRHFLSMEFIDGDDLSSLLRRVGRLSSERAIEIARQLCVGLSAIHNAGILHRDFKPANIIIDKDGKARITDFGIAGVEAEIAKDNLRVGTPAYMSPEQITGRDISAKSDIYALGLVLYEIFTGKQAFIADSIPELIRKQQTETPTNASEFVKGIDPLVESVISQCIEKNPNDRPQSALHVAMALPGGNPLQIALDAGQTPTPEMIAASPKKGALKPKVAAACFAFVVVSMLAIVYLGAFNRAHNLIPFNKSPEVLAENSRRMIKSFGYAETPADSKYHLVRMDGSFLEWAKKNEVSNAVERLRTGQPAMMQMLYRQSPQPLRLLDRSNERVGFSDPPLTIPGMITVTTDTTGRLMGFWAVPPSKTEAQADVVKADWNKFFVEAGLDLSKFEPSESSLGLPFDVDERTAWKGTMADWADIPIRVEAALFQGKPVYFQVVVPWNETQQTNAAGNIVQMAVLGIIGGVFIGVILLVWLNIKKGRADLRGTGKLVLFFSLLSLVTNLIIYDHVSSPVEEFGVLTSIIQRSLFGAFFIGLIYCALEPFVRRWWSEYLISWSRLLVGDFRDPMVGRDVLIGAVAANLIILIQILLQFIAEFGLGATRTVSRPAFSWVTESILHSIAGLSHTLLDQVNFGLGFLALFLIFYFVIRNKKATLIVFGVMFLLISIPSLFNLSHPIIYLGTIFFLLSLIFILNRYGIVALISFAFWLDNFLEYPLTFDTANIAFSATVTALVIMVGTVAYAAYNSIGGAKLFDGRSLLD